MAVFLGASDWRSGVSPYWGTNSVNDASPLRAWSPSQGPISKERPVEMHGFRMNVVGTQTFSPRYIVTIQVTGQEVVETVPVFYPVVLSRSLNEAWRWLGRALRLPGCQWEPGGRPWESELMS